MARDTPVSAVPPQFPQSGLLAATYTADAQQDAENACKVLSLWDSEPTVNQFLNESHSAGGNATADEAPDAPLAAQIAYSYAFQAHEIASIYLTGNQSVAWDQFALNFRQWAKDETIDNPASHAQSGNDLGSIARICQSEFGDRYPNITD